MSKGEQYTYKWVVLAGSSLVAALTWGLLYAVGILYSSWVRYFDAPAKVISVIGGLPISLGCIGGPIHGIIINKLGFRRAGSIGGLVMAFGMMTSCFCESVATLAITFGVITGFGAGLVNLSGCAALNDYFLQSRAFAEGVSGSGLCFGTFVISALQQRLVQDYQWQGAILIIGAICLHTVLASLFFIPLERISTHSLNLWKRKDKIIDKNEEEMSELKAIKGNNDELPDIETEIRGPDNKIEDRSLKGFLRRSCVLWKNYVFLLILTSDFLTWLAIFVPYVHLVERARLEGVNENTASWLSSTIGLAGIVGRPVTGYLCDKFRLNPLWCYCTIQMLVGLAMICSSFSSNVFALFIFAACFGFLSNGYGLIKASAAVLLGSQNFVDAFSWMLFFEGIGTCLGPFLAGWIYDLTQSYTWSFRFAGFVLLLSASLCFLKRFAENAERIKTTNRKNMGALLIIGAICLHNVLASLFFIPLERISTHSLNLWKRKDKIIDKNEEEMSELKAIKGNNDELPDIETKIRGPDNNIKDNSLKGFLRRSCVLWKNYVFLLIVTSDFLTWLAIFVPYVHLVERARLEGVNENTASWLSSTIGLAGIVGRPVTGYLCDKFRLNPLWCYCTIQILVGLAMICSSFSPNVFALFIFAACFGFLSNGHGLIRASAAILLGPQNFVDAFSWMLFFEGMGTCLGPFLAGWIYNLTQSYTWSFRLAGFVLLISASLCFFKKFAENAERIKTTNRKNMVIGHD